MATLEVLPMPVVHSFASKTTGDRKLDVDLEIAFTHLSIGLALCKWQQFLNSHGPHRPLTLKQARFTRPLTTREIKRIMRVVLKELDHIHDEGFLHNDVRMENIILTGLDLERPGDPRKIAVQLVGREKLTYYDTGEPPKPGNLAFRSPETLFGVKSSNTADIWSWCLVVSKRSKRIPRLNLRTLTTAQLVHLFEAQVAFHSLGLYEKESMIGKGTRRERRQFRQQVWEDFGFADSFDWLSRPKLKRRIKRRSDDPMPRVRNVPQVWRRRGVPADAVRFFERYMVANPWERCHGDAILRDPFLLDDEAEELQENIADMINGISRHYGIRVDDLLWRMRREGLLPWRYVIPMDFQLVMDRMGYTPL